MNIKPIIANAIKWLIEDKGLSAHEVATITGVSYFGISHIRILDDATPYTEAELYAVLSTLAEHFNIDVEMSIQMREKLCDFQIDVVNLF